MTQTNPIKKIVCATRGGKASLILQAKAVQLAKTEKADLVFVYIVNIESLGEMNEKMAQAAREELAWFGNALLQVAQLRAQRAGVRAEIVVREGNVRDKIEEVLREKEADLLVLGTPHVQKSTPAFEEDSLTRFARQIESDTGVRVRIIALDED